MHVISTAPTLSPCKLSDLSLVEVNQAIIAWWKVMEEKGFLDIEVLASGVLAKWVNGI